jgi:hypothetical protein
MKNFFNLYKVPKIFEHQDLSLLTLGLNLALGNVKFDIGLGFVPNLGWRHWGNSFWVTIRDEESKMGSNG